ncbi:MAG TPA: 6-phosphogluconolactonase [Lacipirellulaceae bacterium]|nr:6-phosphogluconolactonase [Lacipirellulaceae bacterium]
MNIEVLADADAVAQQAAKVIAEAARKATDARGQFVFAVSGGRTPWQMLRALAAEDILWSAVQIFQVDERIAPPGDADRNLTHLRESLLEHAPIEPAQIRAMPVNDPDLNKATTDYARELQEFADNPPVLDLIHLGLGPDGHTASLIPNDPVVQVTNCDVALTGEYQNRCRMTLTYPIINRARQILWLVTGSDKAGPLVQLRNADPAIPAGRVNQAHAMVLADKAAAANL